MNIAQVLYGMQIGWIVALLYAAARVPSVRPREWCRGASVASFLGFTAGTILVVLLS